MLLFFPAAVPFPWDKWSCRSLSGPRMADEPWEGMRSADSPWPWRRLDTVEEPASVPSASSPDFLPEERR